MTKTKDSDSAQAQFSIYKISDEEVRKACNITHEISEPGYAKEVIKALTYKIVAELMAVEVLNIIWSSSRASAG